MSTNVVKMHPRTPLDTVAADYRAGRAMTEQGRELWIAGTLKMMDALAAGRAAFPSDVDFSVWLAENELDDLGRNDRAALLRMAAHRTLAEQVLRESDRNSYHWIWLTEMQSRIHHAMKPDSTETSSAISPESASVAEVSRETPVATEASDSKEVAKVDRRDAFYGRARAAEVSAVLSNWETRRTVVSLLKNKNTAKEIWTLLLWSIDHGFLTKDTAGSVKAPTLRLLFPALPVRIADRFDLSSTKSRREIRERILPAVEAHRDAILADPSLFLDIIRSHWLALDAKKQAENAEAKVAAARQAMADGEEEVVLYGQRLWPQVDARITYTYGEVCAAAWTFRDLLNWIGSQETPKGRAILIKRTTRWLAGLAKETSAESVRRTLTLIAQIATYYEQSPDGVVIYPTSPKSSD